MRPNLLVLAMLLVSALPLRAEQPLAPDELLAHLRARDLAIENRKLQYVTSGEFMVDFWRADTSAPRRPEKIRFQRQTTIVVQGPGVTWEDIADPLAKIDQSRMSSFYKGSNVDGTLRSMTRGHRPGTRCDATMNVAPGGYPVDVFQEHGMAAKFAHGVGFGERIRTIDRVTPRDEGYLVTGTMQIWWEDYTTFELLVDSNHLVRKAAINADVNGHKTRFVVSTAGTSNVGDVVLATQGAFRRTNPGYERPPAGPSEQFKSEFRSLSAPLTPDEYRQFIAIPEEPGMQVWNHVKNEKYIVGEPKSKPKQRRDLP